MEKIMKIDGKWNSSQEAKSVSVSVISSTASKRVSITMENRPDGLGSVTSNSPGVVLIDFQDDATYVGTLINDNEIQWSRLGELRPKNIWRRLK